MDGRGDVTAPVFVSEVSFKSDWDVFPSERVDFPESIPDTSDNSLGSDPRLPITMNGKWFRDEIV